MRSVRMLVIGAIMAIAGVFGGKEAWGDRAAMQALLKDGLRGQAFIQDKKIEVKESQGRRGRTNRTSYHIVKFMFSVSEANGAAASGTPAPKGAAETPKGAASAAEPESVMGEGQLVVSEEFYGTVAVGQMADLVVGRGESEDAVFVNDLATQKAPQNKLWGMIGLAVVGILLGIFGVSKKE
jgi:hypothetical protein